LMECIKVTEALPCICLEKPTDIYILLVDSQYIYYLKQSKNSVIPCNTID